jgi:hypothetical protein
VTDDLTNADFGKRTFRGVNLRAAFLGEVHVDDEWWAALRAAQRALRDPPRRVGFAGDHIDDYNPGDYSNDPDKRWLYDPDENGDVITVYLSSEPGREPVQVEIVFGTDPAVAARILRSIADHVEHNLDKIILDEITRPPDA